MLRCQALFDAKEQKMAKEKEHIKNLLKALLRSLWRLFIKLLLVAVFGACSIIESISRNIKELAADQIKKK